MTDSTKLLRELIALPSVNPAFLPPNDPLAGEGRVAEFVMTVAASAGLDVELQPVDGTRSNVLARLTPPGRTLKRVVLAPHLDTVGADDFAFRPRLKRGKLFGRGACDTKGSIAAMLVGLCAVAMTGKRPKQTEILFAGLIDEECGQAGSRALAASGLQADLAVVGEPTQLQVVTAHKGDVWLRIETQGKAAHGSRPELGKNAIHEMARIVALLETEYGSSLQQRTHKLLGAGTINVGVIQGGTQPNIVPDRCSISIDRRTLPGETEASVRREISTLLRNHGLRGTFASDKQAPCSPLETNPDAPIVQAFLSSAGRKQSTGVDFFCDAAVLAEAGIPSIVYGPGNIAQAHTRDEWISLRELEAATGVFIRFLRSLV